MAFGFSNAFHGLIHGSKKFQGGRNAGTEQNDQLPHGLAELPLPRRVPLRGGATAVASEDLLREEEASLERPS